VPRDAVDRAVGIHFNAIFAGWIGGAIADHRDEMTPYAIAFAEEMAEKAAGATFYDGLECEARVHEVVGQVLEEHDALLCATVATRGLVAGDDYVGYGPEVAGEPLPHYFDTMLTAVFNVCSRCPVLAVPSGFADNGVPTGIQIVGRTYDDVVPFRLGAALERLRPWLDAPARRPMSAQIPA